MKRIYAVILLIIFLAGCGKQFSKTSDNELSKTSNTAQTKYAANMPSEYKEILSQYEVIVKSWSSDNDEEGHPNFTKDFENNKLPYPNGSEKYEWAEMLIDGKYPKNSKYGYILKDINKDGVPEMFWVYEDYTILAAFTIANEKAITIGAYRPKARAIILDSGEVYEYRSGGADIYELSLLELRPDSDRFTVIKRIGRYRDENFYEIKDGKEVAITEADFETFTQQYPFPLEPTESWKKNTIYSVCDSNFIEDHITVGEKVFLVEEINKGIKDTFNNILYYHGDISDGYVILYDNIILNTEINYSLYFDPIVDTGQPSFVFPQKIYLVVTNPVVDPNKSNWYEFGIDITELGLRSDFSYQSYVQHGQEYSFIKEHTVYLGDYTMQIDEIKKPEYEEMDDAWKKKAETAIKMYMKNNDFYADKERNLLPGKYRVYVQSFFESDKDSTIVFENENGDVYVGFYYFVHDISENEPADLNKVALISSSDKKTLKTYLERIRSASAITVEGSVTTG